jgi:hypothetical protein
LLTACLLAGSGGAQAQGILVDPMRPADVVERPASSSAGAPAAGPGVQVILTSPERRLALIDGRVVDARGTASSLSLHPGIAKKTRKQP